MLMKQRDNHQLRTQQKIPLHPQMMPHQKMVLQVYSIFTGTKLLTELEVAPIGIGIG